MTFSFYAIEIHYFFVLKIQWTFLCFAPLFILWCFYTPWPRSSWNICWLFSFLLRNSNFINGFAYRPWSMQLIFLFPYMCLHFWVVQGKGLLVYDAKRLVIWRQILTTSGFAYAPIICCVFIAKSCHFGALVHELIYLLVKMVSVIHFILALGSLKHFCVQYCLVISKWARWHIWRTIRVCI